MSDYIPVLPDVLRPPIPRLTTLVDWKNATTLPKNSFGMIPNRDNKHTLQIDKAIADYHNANRSKDKLIALYKINLEANAWLNDKLKKGDSSSRLVAYKMLSKHAKALCRYPYLDQVNRIAYRGDSRHPGEIFKNGLQPMQPNSIIELGPDGHTWNVGKNGEKVSTVVSTSLQLHNMSNHYALNNYIYLVKANDGIDLRDNGDFEIALLNVPPEDVIAALGRVVEPARGEEDLALLGQWMNLDIKMDYFKNPRCQVPSHETKLYKVWFKMLAGRQDEVDHGVRNQALNMIRGNGDTARVYPT